MCNGLLNWLVDKVGKLIKSCLRVVKKVNNSMIIVVIVVNFFG